MTENTTFADTEEALKALGWTDRTEVDCWDIVDGDLRQFAGVSCGKRGKRIALSDLQAAIPGVVMEGDIALTWKPEGLEGRMCGQVMLMPAGSFELRRFLSGLRSAPAGQEPTKIFAEEGQ